MVRPAGVHRIGAKVPRVFPASDSEWAEGEGPDCSPHPPPFLRDRDPRRRRPKGRSRRIHGPHFRASATQPRVATLSTIPTIQRKSLNR